MTVGFAVEYAYLIASRVEIVQALLLQVDRECAGNHAQMIFFEELIHFHLSRGPVRAATCVSVKLAETSFAEVFGPRRKNTPGVKRTSAFPFNVVMDLSPSSIPVDFASRGLATHRDLTFGRNITVPRPRRTLLSAHADTAARNIVATGIKLNRRIWFFLNLH